MIKKIFQHLLYFNAFFWLFYFEPANVGGITFSQLWKIPLILFVIIYLILFKKIKIHPISYWGYIYSFKNAVSVSLIEYPIETIILSIKFATIPLFLQIFNNYFVSKVEKIKIILVSLSFYVILASVPFMVNILQPLGTALKFDRLGISDEFGFVGFFQSSHACAIITSLAIINLLFFLKDAKDLSMKLLYVSTITLGIVVVYLTYVRTGYFMLVTGILILYLDKVNLKTFFKSLLLGVSIYLVVFYLFENSYIFRARIEDKSIYSNNSNDWFSQVGSGRLVFSSININEWIGSNLIAFTIGIGEEVAMDNMYKKIGFRIFSHNGFVDIAITNGLLGIIIYSIFFRKWFITFKRNPNNQFYRLLFAYWMVYIAFMLVQGGVYFLSDIFIALTLSLFILNNQNKNIDGEKPNKILKQGRENYCLSR
jgi:hypothetical protein